MGKSKKENNVKFSPMGKAIIAVSLSIAFFITAVNIGVYTYAKYHSEDSGKGVATVSADFFFMSNYLAHVNSISWPLAGYANESEAVDESHNFDYVYCDDPEWTATTPCAFNLEIYNYENTLRYNAETIEYTLYVKMLDTPQNPKDKYEFIVYDDERTVELSRYTLNDGGLVTIKGLTLAGDAPNKNSFTLLVNPNNPDDYSPANVIMYAEITAPDYVDSDVYYLGAIFSPQAAKQSFSVSGAFDVEAEIDSGADWVNSLNGLSGYIYTATTEGEADSPERNIILYWNNKYVHLDLHNGFYTEQTVLNSDGVYDYRNPIEYDGLGLLTTDDGSGESVPPTGEISALPPEKQASGYTNYLIYHCVANKSESFIFYKSENWNTEQETNEAGENIMLPSTYNEFKKIVKVALY